MFIIPSNTFRLTLIIFILLLLLSGTSNCQSQRSEDPGLSGYQQYYPYNYSIKRTVARVIDGDTFVLTDSQRVRMLGIDTPELVMNGKPAESFSDSAHNFTKSLIDGKIIKLTFACPSEAERRRDGKAFDIFGRLLAYVWLTATNGKILFSFKQNY